jgi:hypothetical protein
VLGESNIRTDSLAVVSAEPLPPSDLHLPLDDEGGWVGVMQDPTAQPSHLFGAEPAPRQ